ncbi:hypothetical protein ACJRO7_004720 [Eucalyptus globulus]|uniref:Uncharacterized protein n=1 Tax=Eucalyptus globulus TaxID=34317 RepID=A0ABD3J0U4_EUCGL
MVWDLRCFIWHCLFNYLPRIRFLINGLGFISTVTFFLHSKEETPHPTPPPPAPPTLYKCTLCSLPACIKNFHHFLASVFQERRRQVSFYLTKVHINMNSFSRLLSSIFKHKKGAELTPEDLDLISKSFDESLLSQLQGLSLASVSLAWLSSAVGVLKFAHSAVKSLLPDLKLEKDYRLPSWYVDGETDVVDLYLYISDEIARLCRHHMMLRFTIEHLHSDPNPSKEEIHLAITLLADLEGKGRDGAVKSTGKIEELIGKLAASIGTSAPQEQASPLERAVHRMFRAAIFMTMFIAGVIYAASHASPGALGRIQVPEEFPWADSFCMIETVVTAELRRNQEKERKTSILKELDDVEECLRRLIEAMDEVAASGGSGERVGRVREMAAALEKATKVLVEGAYQLREAMMEQPSPKMSLKVYFAMEKNKVKVIFEI